ncbi:MAG TPA: hypothetical protein VGS14_01585 [Actinomycetes bacterium]|nr:hypothetical protein [Actinomycetes bacterium]
MPDDRVMPPDLLQQLTLAILDHSADGGLRTIKAIRAYLDGWEAFLQDRQELLDHLLLAHRLHPSCMEADPATLNRRHWEAHGSDLATFLGAHPVQV